MAFVKLGKTITALLGAFAMFSAQGVSAADNHYSIVDSHLRKNDGHEISS
jgi:hypothetical protein